MASRRDDSAGDRGSLITPFRVLVGTGIILAILVAVGILQARQFAEAQALRNSVNESYEVRANIEMVLLLHQDIETGQRGFVVTGEERFLEPYHDARRRIGPALEALRPDLAHAGDYDGLYAQLAMLSGQKLRFSDLAISVRATGDADAAARLIAGGQGKAIMDRIRSVVARMDSIEQRHLAEGIAEADRSGANTRKLTFGLEALLLMLLGLSGWIISRSLAAAQASSERLRELSARQEAIFDATTDGMLTLDAKGVIGSLNPAAAAMYGYAPEELVGRNIGILFETPPDQEGVETFLSTLAASPKGAGAKVQEFEARRRDGGLLEVDVATSPVPLAGGIHFVAVVRDATERKRVERMKTEFVSTVSHELRTPLTSIAGSLGLLAGGAAGALPDRAGKLIRIAHENSERLVRLINDILDIEKIESGKMVFDVKEVALGHILDQAIEANRAYADKYGVVLLLDRGGEGAAALADPDRLIQVLTNLLSNAIKFSPPGETVTAAIAPGADRHRITISDKGPGIPDAFKARIFAKFAQADSSDTRQKGGTGLGLSIVREIVEKLGGAVSFDSEAGKGTSFHVDLPAAAPAPALGDREPKPRILICHGDSSAAGDVERTLRGAGFACDVAHDAEAVRSLTQKNDYAAILLDLTLLGADAPELIRHLRCDPRHASTPILAAAPDGVGGEMSQAIAIVDWLHKPLADDRILAGVRDAIAAGGQPCILHVEDDADVVRVVASAFEGRADLKAVSDIAAARAALKQRDYDLVILDLSLPGGSGLELLPEMRREDKSPTPVVIFTAHDEHPEITRLVKATLTKSRASLADLVRTVETVIARTAARKDER